MSLPNIREFLPKNKVKPSVTMTEGKHAKIVRKAIDLLSKQIEANPYVGEATLTLPVEPLSFDHDRLALLFYLYAEENDYEDYTITYPSLDQIEFILRWQTPYRNAKRILRELASPEKERVVLLFDTLLDLYSRENHPMFEKDGPYWKITFGHIEGVNLDRLSFLFSGYLLDKNKNGMISDNTFYIQG